MRILAWVLVASCAAIGAIFLAIYLFIIWPIESSLAPASPEDNRVGMMQENPDAVILESFVTGDVPRLLQGDALTSRAAELWFIDNTDAGNIIGASLFTLMGLPPVTDIGTSFRNGEPISNYSCITVDCMHWPKQNSEMWGMAALAGLGEEIGPEVQKHRETFYDHDAYLAADEAALQDPQIWFASTTQVEPAPPDDGVRHLVVSLPTLFSELSETSKASSIDYPPHNHPDIDKELTQMAASLIEGTDATIGTVRGSDAQPIWVTQDDTYVREKNGGTRALTNLVYHQPVIRLKVPVGEIALIEERAKSLSLPPSNSEMVAPAIRSAFESWNFDATCLPECGGIAIAGGTQERLEVNVAGAPSWILEFWKTGVN